MISQENFGAHKQLVLEDYEREVQGKSGGLSYWYYVQSAKGMIESFEQLQAENAALRDRVTLLEAALRDWLGNLNASKSPTFYKELFGGILERSTLQALEKESGAGNET